MEFEIVEGARIGLTGEYLKSDYVEMTSSAFLTRFATGKGSAFLFEAGTINLKPANQGGRTGFYAFLQPYMKIARGFHFLTTVEYYTSEITEDRSRFMRWGPGFQYFPFQRLELRTEIWNERSFDPEKVRKDDWSVLSQVHLWL